MAIEFVCECGKNLIANDQSAGRLTQCPRCGDKVRIPPLAEPPIPEPSKARRWWNDPIVIVGCLVPMIVLGWFAVYLARQQPAKADQQEVAAGNSQPNASPRPVVTTTTPAVSPMVVSDAVETDPVRIAHKWLLSERYGEAERVLRDVDSPQAKAIRATLIYKDAGEMRRHGLTDFDPDEADRLASEAIQDLQRSAESDPLSQCLLGMCFGRGIGVSADEQVAFAHYQKAAEQSEPLAMTCLALCYQDGIGTEKDAEKSLEWIKRASDAGDTFAMLALARRHEYGDGVPLSLASAFFLYEKAADAGNTEAMMEYSSSLAIRSMNGMFDSPDATEIERSKKIREASHAFVVRAAEADDALAMQQLALRFEPHGFDTSPDVDAGKAFVWHTKASASGLPLCVAGLARCYRDGIGCSADRAVADTLWERAKSLAKDDPEMVARIEGMRVPQGISFGDEDTAKADTPTETPLVVQESADLDENDPLPREASRPPAPAVTPVQSEQLVLIDTSWERAPIGDFISTQGRIRNVSGRPLKRLSVVINFEDASGRLVKTGHAFVEPRTLMPGKVGTFSGFDIVSQPVAKYDLDFLDDERESVPFKVMGRR